MLRAYAHMSSVMLMEAALSIGELAQSQAGPLRAAASFRGVAPPFDPKTRALLEAPIATTLLKIAAPNVLVMLVQASVGLIETYFVSWLGTDARTRARA